MCCPEGGETVKVFYNRIKNTVYDIIEENEEKTVCIKNVKKESKPKKPIYKKWWFWVVVAILVINIFNRLGGNDSSSVDISEFEWNNMALAEIIPEPESNLGSHLMNSEDYSEMKVWT